MWYENGWEIYGPKRPIRSKEIDTSYFLIDDAIWVMQERNPHQATLLARAARFVLSRWGLKFCRSCRQAKIVQDFYPISVSILKPDGRMTYCKECDKSKHSDYVNDNMEKLKEYRREYYRSRKVINDFRDLENREHTLYRLYSKSSKLLYVGITCNFKNRWQQHKYSQPWWEEVSTYEVESYGSRSDVLAAEMLAIKTEFPVHNKTHAES